MCCRIATLIIIGGLAAGCAAPHVPAPVRDLSLPAQNNNLLAPPDTYLVRKGDTLFSIAFLYDLNFQTVAALNDLPAPYILQPGQSLRLQGTPSKGKNKQKQLTAGQSNNDTEFTGQTSKIKVNQPVDRQKSQAYVDSKRAANASNGTPSETYIVSSWVWPADGEIVEQFSLREQGNKGLDIANQAGTTIVAAAEGKVVYTGDALRGFGNLIIIKHSDDYLTAYAHTQQILVKEQDVVKAGQKIALMGKSGTDRVKLHFEIRYRGRSVDPQRFLPKR